MFDLGTQLVALRDAFTCLGDIEGALFALAAVLILWMARHDWDSMATLRRH